MRLIESDGVPSFVTAVRRKYGSQICAWTPLRARGVYGPLFNPRLTLKALSFFGDGNLDRLPRDLQDRLAQAAREVDLDRLPGIADLVRSFDQDFRTKP